MCASPPRVNRYRVGQSTSFRIHKFKNSRSRNSSRGRGWILYRVYSDGAIGSKERRPGHDALMSDARRRLFDVVVVLGFDRFARSLRQFVLALEEFCTLRIDFISHREALDTSAPMGKAVFTIFAAMAELERSIIWERAVSGLDHARLNGTRSGRAVGRPRVVFDRAQVVELRSQGRSWRAIARECGAGVTTIRRIHKAITTSIGVPQPRG